MGKEFALIPTDTGKLTNVCLSGNILWISSDPQAVDRDAINREIGELVARRLAVHFRPEIEQRVRKWHREHFDRPLGRVGLRHKHSNWGSCSSKGNINIAIRLLFAPREVQDYVLVHELAHLHELNHSKRFWDIVARVYPEYRQAERWLRENAHHCRF